MSRARNAKRFTGLTLPEADIRALKGMQFGAGKMSARTWRRIRTLLLLHEGNSVGATAKAVGGYKREVSRVGKRYLARGLHAALTEDPRPTRKKSMDSAQEAAVVALACGPPPEGRARWTIRLLAEEAVKRGIIKKVGREKIRVVLANHATKPWREKNVVRSEDRSGVRGSNGEAAATARAST